MLLLLFKLYLLCSRLHTLTEATSKPAARMTFTLRETAMKRFPLLGHHAPAGIVLEKEPSTVISAEQKRLKSFNFQNPHEAPVEIHVPWTECNKSDPQQTVKADCSFNIYLVQKMEANKLFLCGTDGKGTACCDMDLSEKTPRCMSSAKIQNIKKSIQGFIIKEGEPAALVESADSNLYVTYSGSKGDVGIHRFGRNRVGPMMHDREQHYVGLVPSRRRDHPLQGKVFGFYKEKNKDPGLYSDMWIPFVTRVCMGDRGGPKNFLQFSWTSQMNARLFCGEPESRRHFSELVDVATVEKEQWEDTRVYALFRNEWGMSAVCVYTIKDIERIFTTSRFKGKVPQPGRSRACVQDSSAIHMDVLNKIKENSEMEEWVRPVDNSGPILFNHHNYTHIYVDDSQNNRSDKHTVLYLSLNKGDIHKVVQKETETFVIAEYQPFHHRHHVLTFLLHPPTMKLYLTSRTELVQLDVGNCAQYGDRCGDCVLSRDPYCGWNGSHCTPHTQDMLQDVSRADHNICVSSGMVEHSQTVSKYPPGRDDVTKSITLPLNSKYFLQCPVSSHQARYTWIHLEGNTSWSLEDSPGLLLIPRMSPEQEGRYRCVSEERGYTRVLADYTLQLESRAGVQTSTSLLLGLCVTAALIQSLTC
ncbi:hypothetical protein JOQ06_021520 [Pogonophryne albipinna]|uniref:Sema domain-containing protein n=1 Tax=Pogonophryne albipinna TaxID=1090488 RepID=A0AAD6AC93_9TELE|nr:hypothetical protein JOQ06_021520 [Pogonophryne albipinna]